MPTTIIAIAFSLAMLVLQWRGDPKRRRVSGLPGAEQAAIVRRALLLATLLPGTILALRGDASAFLVWFGACAIGGWLIAQLPARSRPQR